MGKNTHNVSSNNQSGGVTAGQVKNTKGNAEEKSDRNLKKISVISGVVLAIVAVIILKLTSNE